MRVEVDGRLTQGPYRGREVASLSQAELADALYTCPYGEAFMAARSALLGEERRRERARAARKAEQTAKRTTTTRAARIARLRAVMTEAERNAYDAADTTEARRLIQTQVEKRLRVEARRQEQARWDAQRREAQRQHEESLRQEAAKREAWLAAHPDKDLWDYMKARSQESRAQARRDNAHHPGPDFAAEIIAAGYKVLAKRMHPDAGGSDEAMKALNATVERLRKIQHIYI